MMMTFTLVRTVAVLDAKYWPQQLKILNRLVR